MRLPSLHARAPRAPPAGQLTLSSVPGGIGSRSSSSTIRATNVAACSKSNSPPTRKSSAPRFDCCDTAIAGMPSTIPSSAAATVPE